MWPQLIFRSPSGERTVTLDRAIVVGRDPACEVAIDSVRLSRRHAEFSPAGDEVQVRDLGSKNGVLLNGERVEEGRMRRSDRVLLGDVGVTLRIATASGSVTAASGAVVPQSGSLPGAPARATSLPIQAPPLVTPIRQAVAPPLPAAAGDDRTRVLPRASASGTDHTMRLPGRKGSPGRPIEPAAGEESGAPTAGPGLAAKVNRLAGYGPRLAMVMLMPTLLAFLMAWLPMSVAFERASVRDAVSRTRTIALLLAAENRAALAAGERLSIAVRSAREEPGVQDALVMDATGRVLAPPDRLDTTVTTLPGLGSIPALQGPQASVNGSIVEVAAPVDAGGRRVGAVWVRLDRDAVGSAGTNLAVFAALAGAIATGFVASRIVRRMIARRLEAFAVDVELAVAGRLTDVGNTQELPALARVAEGVNYLIERSRGPAAPVVAAGAVMASPSTAVPGAPGMLVLDVGYLVQNADADAGRILGLPAERLVGRHVLEAVQDQALAIVVIDLLGELGPGMSAQRVADGSDGRLAYEIKATRDPQGGAVRLTLRETERAR